jgi:hypothetical protein
VRLRVAVIVNSSEDDAAYDDDIYAAQCAKDAGLATPTPVQV